MKRLIFGTVLVMGILSACSGTDTESESTALAPEEKEVIIELETATEEVNDGLNELETEVDQLNNEIDSLLNDI